MLKSYTRKLSMNEYMFLMADGLCPPVANQVVLEGTGVLDLEKWRSAVQEASSVNPGVRVILRDSPGISKWVDSGKTPGIREVDGSKWTGYGPEGAPFLQDPLPPKEGPTCEVVLVQGNPLRVIFRTHHAVTDAGGTMIWMEDIFRSLEGRPVVGSDSILSDAELARSFQKKYGRPHPGGRISLTGKAEGSDPGFTWKRVQLKGHYRKILPQLAILSAKEAQRHSKGPFSRGIPTDLRRREKELRSTVNLSRMIYQEIKTEDSPEKIADLISKQFSEKRDGMLLRGSKLLLYMPLWLIQNIIRGAIKKQNKNGAYGISGLITSLRPETLKNFSGGGFRPTNFWLIPPCVDTVPSFIVFTTHGDSDILNVTLSCPKVLSTNGRLQEALDRITSGLKQSID